MLIKEKFLYRGNRSTKKLIEGLQEVIKTPSLRQKFRWVEPNPGEDSNDLDSTEIAELNQADLVEVIRNEAPGIHTRAIYVDAHRDPRIFRIQKNVIYTRKESLYVSDAIALGGAQLVGRCAKIFRDHQNREHPKIIGIKFTYLVYAN